MKLKSALRSTVLAIASSAMILAPNNALANSFTYQVGAKLIGTSLAMGLFGRDLTHDPYINTLSDNHYRYVTVNLRAGRSYNIIGVCDEDCHDVDLHLYNENGTLVDYDTSSDNRPMVSVTPRWSGTFRVKVGMPGCRANYCYYGVGVFGR